MSGAAAPAAGTAGRLLTVVGVAYTALQLLFVGSSFGLGWDETVYASQVSRHGPPLLWTAPRARGVPTIIAPVVHFTTSVPALRLYLAVLSGVGLVLAFRPWLRILSGRVVPLAAALFGTIWIAVFYGPAAMPNLFVALTAVAAAGYLLRSTREPSARLPLAGLTGSLAILSLVRPTDSLYLSVPLAIAAVLPHSPRWRRLGAVAVGIAFGWAAWVAEAFVAFGGLFARLHAASAEDAGGAFHVNLLLYAKTMAGPLECCAGPRPWPHPYLALLWWIALVPLTALGLFAARRRGHLAPLLLAVGMAVALSVQYVFVVSVVGVRHLLPVYALLSLPIAEGANWLVHRPVRRAAVVGGVAAVLVAHLAIQTAVLVANVRTATSARIGYVRVAVELNRLGITPPCAITGSSAPPIAYAAGCGQLRWSSTSVRAAAADPITSVAIAVRRSDPRRIAVMRTWRRHPFLAAPGHPWRILTPP